MKIFSQVPRFVVAALLYPILLFGPVSVCEAACGKIRAVSMAAVQERLKACETPSEYPPDIPHFANLTSIIGCTVDYENHDLVIVGEVDQNLPPLHLEDFVIALRCAWGKYGDYDHPLCSIDPDPGVFQQLQDLAREILSSSTPEEVEDRLQEWDQICQRRQKVRVEGIPFHSHFAQIMVKADYDMKSIVDGSDSLAISGFTSLTDITLERVREDIVQNKQPSIPLLMMNRFWFCPGENQYDEDEGMVLISECPVKLLTEEMYLSKAGLTDKGQKSPLAQEFAENFTANYKRIVSERPIYGELENLFSLLALANTIKYKSDETTGQLDLSYLLNEFPITHTSVDSFLSGRSNVKRFRHRSYYGNRYEEAYFWLPSCGGVDMAIPTGPELFRSKDLATFRSRLLNSRPSADAIYWDYQRPPSAFIAERDEKAILEQINELSKNFCVILVEDKLARFRAYDGPGESLCEPRDMIGLFAKIAQKFPTRKTIYFYFKDMPEHEVAGFKTSFQIQQKVNRTDFQVRVFPDMDMIEDFLASKAQLAKESPVKKIGKKWTATFELIQERGKAFIRVLAKTREIAEEFVQSFKESFSGGKEKWLGEEVNKVRQELMDKYELEDLEIEFKDECENACIVIRYITQKVRLI